MSEQDKEQEAPEQTSVSEPQPGADEDGWGGDAPEPAKPAETPGETKIVDDGEDYEPSDEVELGDSRIADGPTTADLNPAYTDPID